MSEGKDTVHYLQAAVETKDAWVQDRALRRAFDDLKTAQDETQKLRQQLSEAGIRISGFIAEREMAKSEVERLRARVAELESGLKESQGWDWILAAEHAEENGLDRFDIDEMEALHQMTLRNTSDAWLLRKQAEAVEAATTKCQIKSATDDSKCYSAALQDYAQRLRQQAGESE